MAPLAVSTGVQITYVVALVVVPFLGPFTVAELKDQDRIPAAGAAPRSGVVAEALIAWPTSRRRRAGVDRIELPGIGNALQGMGPTIGELDPGPSHQVLHGS
jgi:hypothetical protein